MTGSEDGLAGTRPISVAELLARNGAVGASPSGGRRRRRRGNADAVTVAELTGEIPVIKLDEPVSPAGDAGSRNGSAEDGVAVTETAEDTEPAEATETAGTADADADEATPETTDAEATGDTEHAEADDDSEADDDAHVEARDTDLPPVDFQPPARRPHYSHLLKPAQAAGSVGAEEMSPDPVVDDEADDSAVDLVESPDTVADDALFGGDSIADELARRSGAPGPEDIDLDEEAEAESDEDTESDAEFDEEPASKASAFVHGAWVVGQCVIAVALGAGLFMAFDQLWQWNNIVALALGVLVILGLVVGVRVVRKTEDIGSTLIAVVVGALVTFGPLVLPAG